MRSRAGECWGHVGTWTVRLAKGLRSWHLQRHANSKVAETNFYRSVRIRIHVCLHPVEVTMRWPLPRRPLSRSTAAILHYGCRQVHRLWRRKFFGEGTPEIYQERTQGRLRIKQCRLLHATCYRRVDMWRPWPCWRMQSSAIQVNVDKCDQFWGPS